jgi:hypothetical protein
VSILGKMVVMAILRLLLMESSLLDNGLESAGKIRRCIVEGG